MPLYEYKCKECGRHTEKRQKFSDPEITECPYCSGPLERVISAPAIAFKGSGWYKDLYSSAKPAASTNTGEGNSAPAASSDGSGQSTTGASTPAGPAAPAAAPAPASTPAKTT